MCDKWVYVAITVTALATGPAPCHWCSPTLSGCTIHKQEGDQDMYCRVLVYYNINGSIRTCSSIIGACSGLSYLVCCMAESGRKMAAVWLQTGHACCSGPSHNVLHGLVIKINTKMYIILYTNSSSDCWWSKHPTQQQQGQHPLSWAPPCHHMSTQHNDIHCITVCEIRPTLDYTVVPPQLKKTFTSSRCMYLCIQGNLQQELGLDYTVLESNQGM